MINIPNVIYLSQNTTITATNSNNKNIARKILILNLMISFSLVLACTACPLFCVKCMRSTPYLDNVNMMC